MPLLVIPYPAFDPVLVHIGPFAIRWYALAYIAGILLGWLYARVLIRNQKLWGGKAPLTVTDFDDFVVWVTLGIILGAGFNAYFVYIGYDMSKMIGENTEQMMAAYRLSKIVYAIWDLPSYFWAFVVTLFASVIASYIPARKTSEMQPAACLRTNQ